MVLETEIPPTFAERLQFYRELKPALPNPKSPDWFNKELNEEIIKKYFWAAPYDAR
jgi:hypothetical protein